MNTTSSDNQFNKAEDARQRRSDRMVSSLNKVPTQPYKPLITPARPYAKETQPPGDFSRPVVRKLTYYKITPNKEVKLRAVGLPKPSWRWLSFLLALASIFAIYLIVESYSFRVHNVQIIGNQRLATSDLAAVVGITDQPIVYLDSQAASERLMRTFSELRDVTVTASFPAKVTVNMTELQPSILWNMQDASYWIAADGTILPTRGQPGPMFALYAENLPPLVPVAPDPATPEKDPNATDQLNPKDLWGRKVDPKLLVQMAELITKLPQDAQVSYSDLHGFSWKDPQGWSVAIGRDMQDIDLKLSVYQSIMARLTADGTRPTEIVSVENIDAPFYK
ncbi:MAG TPA: FtsQ-type POTRA domain-containing protein [Bellilinea sp.]|nr:FtsQ-type POTRA domain-containing protein [Bellilinea sp.]